MAGNSEFTFNLKLLIDSKSNQVLFAVAGKDLVHLLFNLISLPVSTAITSLNTNSMPGSLGNLYDSFQNMSKTHRKPYQTKESLLNPVLLDSKVFPQCLIHLSNELQFEAPDVGEGESTYILMDDLSVKPMSALSIINLLNKYNIKGVGALKERVVHVGMNEVLKLFQVSLHSKLVLTSVFLCTEILLPSSATSWSCLGIARRVPIINKREGGDVSMKEVGLLKASKQSKTMLTDVYLSQKAGMKLSR